MYLVEHSANIHVNNDQPLRRSAEQGHVEVVKYLIKQGAGIYRSGEYSTWVAAKAGYLWRSIKTCSLIDIK